MYGASRFSSDIPVNRDWSLIIGRGAKKWEGGGHVKFTPTKRVAKKVLAMLKGGGHKKVWGSFYAVS